MSVYTPEYGTLYTGPVVAAAPGQPVTLFFDFFDESTGTPADPTSVELDITYGNIVGQITDSAGPYGYFGAMTPTTGQVYRLGVGQYAFAWQVPPNQPAGVYVANWTAVYGGADWLGTENFVVTGGNLPQFPVPAGDTGYWTGSLTYGTNAVEFGQVDSNGIAWLWNKLEGWDGPDVSGGLIQRSGDHGGWPSPQFFAPRQLTLTVTASAPTQALRDLARALLSQVVPVSDLATLVYGEPVPKQAQVRRSGKIQESYPTLADVQFVIGLVAPDPRKYGTQVRSVPVPASPNTGLGLTFPVTFPITFPPGVPAGQCAVTNFGNFETRPVITITGPVAAPALINLTTGQTVSWTALSLPAGGTLTVDFLNRQATDQNGTYWPADVQSSWWVMPGQAPGGFTTEIQLGGGAGQGAAFTVTWMDAFI